MTVLPPLTDGELIDARRRDDHRRDLMAKQASHQCGECAAPLAIIQQWPGGSWQPGMKPADATLELVCGQDRSHRGIVQEPSLTQLYDQGYALPLPIVNSIEKRRRRHMEEALSLSPQQSRALAPYQAMRMLTQEQALAVVETIWPGAPREEKLKAAILCKDYGLHPLRKHVFLIEYKKRNKQGQVIGSTWSAVVGIHGDRVIARRRGPFSYVDGPRLMTEDEQKAIYGKLDKAKVFAICILQDPAGNRAPGYGQISRDAKIQGEDKGNSHEHMAQIRAERQALDRLRPGELPTGYEVVDASYLSIGNGSSVDVETGEIFEGEATDALPGRSEEETEPEPPPSAPTDVTNSDPPVAPPKLSCVNDLTKAAHERYGLQPKQVYDVLGITSAVEVGPDLQEAWAKVVTSQE